MDLKISIRDRLCMKHMLLLVHLQFIENQNYVPSLGFDLITKSTQLKMKKVSNSNAKKKKKHNAQSFQTLINVKNELSNQHNKIKNNKIIMKNIKEKRKKINEKKLIPMGAKICIFPEPRGRPLPRFSSLPLGWMEILGGSLAGDSGFSPTSDFRGLPLPFFITRAEFEPPGPDFATVSKPASTPTTSISVMAWLVVFDRFWDEFSDSVSSRFTFWSSMSEMPFRF